ncbi:kinase-like protein [Stereum hirsutum FP-91666 SS1]|uniref:kinase-like protein n=1 Tax=Stereum hirsutum (strain FP-91666) TaxID=721885 RepID=UPI000440B52E|nr:kinase-like protein [Stereum hirsutum FP-91666 SS1]EIM90594.1 kinase-like protein [Stereum hirsutum FP-91666 SS1]
MALQPTTLTSAVHPGSVTLSVISEEELGDGASGASGHRSIPEVYAWGKSRFYEYLALELLGRNVLEEIPSTGPLTLRNLVSLACQMLDAIERVHAHGIVHGGIKPDHFLFGLGPGPKTGQIYLIDYGLATRYTRPTSEGPHEYEHVKPYVLREARGTLDYASINIHLRRSPSRTDDLESLSYTLIRLLCVSLPWSTPDMSHWPTEVEIMNQKSEWNGMDLYPHYGGIFGSFVDYCRALGFEERQDYKAWRGRFLDLVAGLGLSGTPLYDPADKSSPPIEPPPTNATPLTHPSRPLSTIQTPKPTFQNSQTKTTAEDVLEDEKRIVRKYVGRIGAVPEMGRRRCFNVESMLTEDEEDEDEERFGGPWAVGVYNRVED